MLFLVSEDEGRAVVNGRQWRWKGEKGRRRAYKTVELVEAIDDVNAFRGTAGHWSRGRPVAIYGPRMGERDEAVDDIFLPGRVYDGGVRRAVFGRGLKSGPVPVDGLEGSWPGVSSV